MLHFTVRCMSSEKQQELLANKCNNKQTSVGSKCVCDGATACAVVYVWVRLRGKEHYKQRTVHRDEADGNQSLDRPGRDEVGEEESGLAGQSNHPQEHQLKQFLCKRRCVSVWWGWTATKKGRQIITVVHSDEATVPDWNINMLEKRREKGGVRVLVCAICFLCICVNVAYNWERALHFWEEHTFPQTRWKQAF